MLFLRPLSRPDSRPHSDSQGSLAILEGQPDLVPMLLGGGERLFEGVGDQLHGFDLVRTVAAPRGDAAQVRQALNVVEWRRV